MVGDSIILTASVKNVGDTAGIYTAALFIDGQQVDSKAITVDPGSSQDVSFQFSKTTAGNYNLAIGNSSNILTVYNWSPYTIKYDESDGVTEGIYVSGKNGHIVRFTPPAQAFRIQKIRIFGFAKVKNTYELDQNRVTVRIWDRAGNNQLWSRDFHWSLFMVGNWQDIQVPDIRVNDDFEVEVVTYSDPGGSEPIDFVSLTQTLTETIDKFGGVVIFRPGQNIPSVICIGFDYPQSYINSPSNRPETRSGYSYMGKLIDPGQKRLEGIRWLIRVQGEGAPAN
jgi:hypothetical protein